MGDVKLNSSGGGSVTLTPPSTASNYTVTLPTANTTLADTSSTQTLTNKTIASLVTTGTATFGGIVNTGSTGQVQFPATQNPSSDANTLDDYEEGTWTPKLSDGTTTVNFGAGTYIKIGSMVYLDINAYNQSFTGLGAGSFLLTNLPFAISQVFDAVLVGSVTDNFPLFAQGSSGTTCQLWHTTTGGVGVAALNKAAFAISTAGSIWGTIVYRAS